MSANDEEQRAQRQRKALREMTHTICNSLIAQESSEERTVRSGYIYIYQSRTVREPQGLNKNKDLEQSLFTEGGTWDHEYAALSPFRSFLFVISPGTVPAASRGRAGGIGPC
jgi:hypothetical protein